VVDVECEWVVVVDVECEWVVVVDVECEWVVVVVVPMKKLSGAPSPARSWSVSGSHLSHTPTARTTDPESWGEQTQHGVNMNHTASYHHSLVQNRILIDQ